MFRNEEKDIYDEWMFLFNNQKNIPTIDTVGHPRYDSTQKIIGKSIKINYNNYREEFYLVSKDNPIPILLADGSMIFFDYVFDEDGTIVEHHLSYLPSPTEKDSLESTLSKIIRIDYEQEGFIPNVHSYTHLHSGKNSSYRFTVENIVYPLEFIAFIILTNYNHISEKIMNELGKTHRSTLTEEEKGFFSLRIKR